MSSSERYLFRLYVAGVSAHSARARENLQSLCREHLPDRHEIEVIDVLRAPHRALQDGILVTPTLIKLSPRPAGRVIGNLSRTEDVLLALGLSTQAR